MAQSGYTPIQLYYSSTTTNVPLAANLAYGELAINITDGKLFYKDNANAVQVIGWKVVPTTAGGTGLTSYTAGDLPYYATGTALSKLGIGASTTVITSSGSAPQWTAQSALSVGTAANLLSNATTGVMQITGPGTGTTRVMTIPNANFTAARTDAAQTFTGQQDFNSNVVLNSSSLQVNAGASSYYARLQTAYNFPYVDAYIDSVAGASYEGRVCIRTNSGGGAMGERMFVWNSGGVSIGSATDPSSGNLSVSKGALFGTTSLSTGGVTMATVLDSRTANTGFGLGVIGNASNTQIMRFAYDTTAVGSIVISSSTTTYNIASDQDLKNDLGVVTETDVIANTVIHDYTWKVDGTKARGPFAQEAHKVNPLAVTVGSDELDENGNKINPWQVDLSKYIPDIIVELQSLRKRVAELEAKG